MCRKHLPLRLFSIHLRNSMKARGEELGKGATKPDFRFVCADSKTVQHKSVLYTEIFDGLIKFADARKSIKVDLKWRKMAKVSTNEIG